ncbi:MAG: flagellar biosynthetic protein FliO [Hyphomicrobiales bacterium]|nr:flagellar biosynthetic protein FliO [Hyphomicrobiales bacterium]
MDWLGDNFFSIFAAAFVIGVALLGLILARGETAAGGFFSSRERRLSVVEQASLDGRRKLVLVRRDQVEHLVLIGGPYDVIVETGIPRPAPAIPAQPPRYSNGAALDDPAHVTLPIQAEPPAYSAPMQKAASGSAQKLHGAAKNLLSRLRAAPAQPVEPMPGMSPGSVMSAPVLADSTPADLGDERQAEKLS